MPDGISIKIDGVDEVNRALRQVDRRLGRKVVTGALRKGALEIAKAARQGAPRRTGRLRRAIRVRKSRRHTHPQKGEYGYSIAIYPGKTRDDPKGAYYGKFVEAGWVVKGRRASSRREVTEHFGGRTGRKTLPGRRKIPGRRFMERAFRNRARQASDLTVHLTLRGLRLLQRQTGLR